MNPAKEKDVEMMIRSALSRQIEPQRAAIALRWIRIVVELGLRSGAGVDAKRAQMKSIQASTGLRLRALLWSKKVGGESKKVGVEVDKETEVRHLRAVLQSIQSPSASARAASREPCAGLPCTLNFCMAQKRGAELKES